MTVIAWDGITLASDKRMTDRSGLSTTVTKISRRILVPGVPCLIGRTGATAVGLQMQAWFLQGAIGKDFPEQAKADVATLIVIDREYGIRAWTAGPCPLVIEEPFYALGAGRDFALAAMALGESAPDAVRLAIRFQSDCGNGVDELTLDATPSTVGGE